VLRDGQELPINATIQAVAVGDSTPTSGARGAGVDDAASRGALASGTRGVFGLAGVQIVTAAAADGHTPLLVSSTVNVALKSGTQLLLVAHGEGSEAGAAAGTVGHATGTSGNPLGSTGS
jgi:hypothetical protein